MKCQHCNHELPPNACFCQYCGAQVEPVPEKSHTAPPQPATIQCASCGSSLREGDAFCQFCGSSIAQTVPEYTMMNQPALPSCPVCGVVVDEDDAFCPDCGARLHTASIHSEPITPTYAAAPVAAVSAPSASQAAPVQTTKKRKKTKRIWLTVCLIVLLLALALAGGYFLGTLILDSDLELPWDSARLSATSNSEDAADQPSPDLMASPEEKPVSSPKPATEIITPSDAEETDILPEQELPLLITPVVEVESEPEFTTEPEPEVDPAPSLEAEPEPEPESEPDPELEYLLPDSATMYLTKDDLKSLTHEECCFARNEIYARHGWIFSVQAIADFFADKSWYRGTVLPADFNYSALNAYENANIALITEYERATWGGSYY